MADPSPSASAIGLAAAMRRSFTLPAKFTESRGARTANYAAGVGSEELLFSHDSTKIVAFSPSTYSAPISGNAARADTEEDKAGVLPWASPTERTIAAGPLRLYRLHSIAFLNSGRTLHAILPKSRCWCVDGRNKFVLRIRSNSYWRIELSGAGEDKTEELKRVFAQILQYETTLCPFKRDFTVELPEPPKTPPRKRPWKAPERPKPLTLERALKPESSDECITALSENGSMGDIEEEGGSDTLDIRDPEEPIPRSGPPSYKLPTDRLVPFTRRSNAAVPRSITAPPRLALETSGSTSSVCSPLQSDEDPTRCPTLSSSVESFHSAQELISPPPLLPDTNPPSPILPSIHHDEGIHISRYRNHKRDPSDATVMDNSPIVSNRSSDGERLSPPSTPTLISDCEDQKDEDWSEVLTPPSHSGLRNRHKHKRALSPLPLAANLISPTAARSPLPGALIQKACSFMLGPPIQLISLMLRIAFKIANGALRGSVSGYGESGEEIVCHWDYSDGGDTFEQGTWEGEEDDFGVPFRGKESIRVGGDSDNGAWEVD
ncbi:MAG: hypothetical protein M1839_000244 [Geoglossum umbratile]|nr:MAG: hypothetical protein M1839_000244 [Geoglossum umbratile]